VNKQAHAWAQQASSATLWLSGMGRGGGPHSDRSNRVCPSCALSAHVEGWSEDKVSLETALTSLNAWEPPSGFEPETYALRDVGTTLNQGEPDSRSRSARPQESTAVHRLGCKIGCN